jgi:hypothetical protein
VADIAIIAGPEIASGILGAVVLSLGSIRPGTPLSTTGGLGFPDAQPRWMLRERDVRRAVRDTLEASGYFDGIYLGSLPEQRGRSSGDLTAATIEPISTRETDHWDASPTAAADLTATLRITVMARDADEEIRDETAERLVNIANNALNGSTLGGLAMPQFTQVQGWTWLPAVAPERRIRVEFRFRYFVAGNQQYNIDP